MMSPGKLFYKINNDRYFLLKSYSRDTLLMCGIISILLLMNWQIQGPSLSLSLMILPFSIMNGLVIASLLHNTAHSNVPTKKLNRAVGEYCGYWVLYGFTNFTLVHLLHHRYSDTVLDPVNPKGMNFFVFLTAPMRYMIKTTKKYLILKHGHHEGYKQVMKTQVALFHLNLVLRLSIWYLILGKSLFLSVYLPGALAIVTVFAHINYVCHERHGEDVVIVNLNHNLYYKIANFFTMGGYYHRNHHHNMKAFNPMYLKGDKYDLSMLPGLIAEKDAGTSHQSA